MASLMDLPNVTAVSGILDTDLAFDGSPFGRLCNGEAACDVHLQLPINQEIWREGSLVQCVRLESLAEEYDSFKAVYSVPEPLMSTTPEFVTCRTDFFGKFLILQRHLSNSTTPVDGSYNYSTSTQSVQEIILPPPPPLSENQLPDNSVYMFLDSHVFINVPEDGFDSDWELERDLERGLAIALFNQFPQLFDRGWGVVCFRCVQAWARSGDPHDLGTLVRVLAPRATEINFDFNLPPDTSDSEKQELKDYIIETPVDVLFANSTSGGKVLMFTIETHNFHLAPEESQTRSREVEAVAAELGGILQSPPSWFDKTPGQTLYSSLKGVDVAFSRAYLSNITTGPNIFFPAASEMMAGVQIPQTHFSKWCSTQDGVKYCEQESTLETVMTYTRNATFYTDLIEGLRFSPGTKFVSGVLDVQALLHNVNKSSMVCEVPASCKIMLTIPINKSLQAPNVTAACVRLEYIPPGSNQRFELHYDARALPHVIADGSAPDIIACLPSRPGKPVIVQNVTSLSPFFQIAAVVNGTVPAVELTRQLAQSLFQLSPSAMQEGSCSSYYDCYYNYAQQACEECVEIVSMVPGLSGKVDAQFKITPVQEVAQAELQALEFAAWSKPADSFFNRSGQATYIFSSGGAKGAELPLFTFNVKGSIGVDHDSVTANDQSQRRFQEEVFFAVTNGILSLDQEGNATFIQRSLDGTVVHVGLEEGSSTATNVTANITMSYPYFTQAKFDSFMGLLAERPTDSFTSSNVTLKVNHLEASFRPAAAPKQSQCEFCEVCVTEMYTRVVLPLKDIREEEGGSGFVQQAANVFMQACTGIADVETCQDVSSRHITSTSMANVAPRAGALCNALNRCNPENDCELNSLATGVEDVKMDFCTTDGTIAGQLIGSKNSTLGGEGRCFSSSDCSGTNFCGLSSSLGVEPQTQHRCNAFGYDEVFTSGECLGPCKRPRIQDLLNQQDSTFARCSADSDWKAGYVCGDANERCTEYACNPSSGEISSSACNKTCNPKDLTLGTAKFSDSASAIEVTLSAKARGFSGPCSYFMNETTLQLIGSSASCSVAGEVLTVSLSGEASVKDGDRLTLKDGQTTLVYIVDGTAFSGSSDPVAICNPCEQPVATIYAPRSVTAPCGNATIDQIILSGSNSISASGRPFQSVKWELMSAPSAYDNDLPQDNATNLYQILQAASSLTVNLEHPTLDALALGSYEIRLTVTSLIGQVSVADHMLEKQASGITPSATITTPSQVYLSSGLTLDGDVSTSSVCEGSEASYRWLCDSITHNGVVSDCRLLEADGAGTSLSTVISNEDLLSAGILSGDAVTFTLTSAFVDGDQSSQDSLDVTFLGSSLEARLSGPSGLVEQEGEFEFSAEDSSDPNDPFGQIPLSYAFDCIRQDDPLLPCFDPVDYQGVQDGGKWIVNTSKFAATGVPYEIIVTVSKARGGETRESSASNVVVLASTQVVKLSIRRFCGSGRSCPTTHNPTGSLTLSVNLEDVDVSEATYSWRCPGSQVNESSTQLDDSNTLGTTSNTINISPEAIPRSGSLTVECEVTISGGSQGCAIAQFWASRTCTRGP